MNCSCKQLPHVFNIEKFDDLSTDRLEAIEKSDNNWLTLYRCPYCNQYWQIDLIDKYQINLAIKINDPNLWKHFDDKPIRQQYLVDSYGGVSNEICVKLDCKNKALRSLAYCPEHAWEIGLRE